MSAIDISICKPDLCRRDIAKRQYYNEVSYAPGYVQKGTISMCNEYRSAEPLVTQISPQVAMRFLQQQTANVTSRKWEF
jgi:hypothetical protein